MESLIPSTKKVAEGRTSIQSWEDHDVPSPPTAPQEVVLDTNKRELDSKGSRYDFRTIYGYVHELNRIVQKVKARMLASRELKLARKREKATWMDKEAIYYGAVADNDPVRFWLP